MMPDPDDLAAILADDQLLDEVVASDTPEADLLDRLTESIRDARGSR